MNKANITLFLETYFNKKIDEISPVELSTIKSFTVNGIDYENLDEINYQEIFSILPNIEELIIVNSIVKPKDIYEINKQKIKYISFRNCAFENIMALIKLETITSISLLRCFINSYNFLKVLSKHLVKLEIRDPQGQIKINLKSIAKQNLQELILETVELENQDFSDCMNCTTISLLNTDIEKEGLDSLLKLKLKNLYIEEVYKKKLEKVMLDTTISSNWNVFYFDDYEEYKEEDEVSKKQKS